MGKKCNVNLGGAVAATSTFSKRRIKLPPDKSASTPKKKYVRMNKVGKRKSHDVAQQSADFTRQSVQQSADFVIENQYVEQAGYLPAQNYSYLQHLKQASYVTPMINSAMIKNEKFDYLFPNSPVKKISNVPKQGCSVDCALFVIKFMGVVVFDEDSFVTSENTNNAMDKMRAKIAHDLLTDKALSFDKITREDQQELVRLDAEENKSLAEALKVTEEKEKKRLAAKKANFGKQKKKK